MVYHAKSVASRTVQHSVFAVGDAAFGVPFFRALNNGLISASFLAKCIHAELSFKNGESVTPLIEMRASLLPSLPTAKCDEDENQGDQKENLQKKKKSFRLLFFFFFFFVKVFLDE